jgi:steroid delta-isomerase-like uncharacterized protein
LIALPAVSRPPTETDALRTTPEQVARSYFAALADRDARRMAEHWHPEGVEDLIAFGIYRGPDEVRGFFDELFAAIPDAETVVDRVVADDRHAVVQWRLRGNFSGGRFQGLDAPGKWVETRGCDVLEIEDGLIARNTAYSDGLDFARQIGMLPPQGSSVEKALYGAFNGANKLRKTLEERIGGSN